MKKVFALLLSVFFCLSVLSLTAFAETAEEAPEGFVSMVDWDNADLEGYLKSDLFVAEDGMIKADLPSGTFYDPGHASFVAQDDATGEPDFTQIKEGHQPMDAPLALDGEGGFAMYLELSENLRPAETFILWLGSYSADENGELMTGEDNYGDVVYNKEFVEIDLNEYVDWEDVRDGGFAGWIVVPAADLAEGMGLWGGVDENGYFDVQYANYFQVSIGVYSYGNAQVNIGELGFYGLEEVEEESSTPEEESSVVEGGNDSDNTNKVPDTGVTGVVGAASVVAVIALAAVVCFGKKD